MSSAAESMQSIELPGPDDFHVHVRQGEGLPHYVRTLSKSCRRALIMPNTVPPITTVDDIERYRGQIVSASPDLIPFMTFKVLPSIDPAEVEHLRDAGAVAGKYYPSGVTTNAEDGVRDPGEVEEILASMEEAGLVLCIHAESPEAGVLERERAFLPVIERIVAKFPSLRIVIEHVSDATTVALVNAMPAHVAATITVHHLLFTIEDLLGSGIRPHLYCKPLLKQIADRDAIQRAVLDGNDRFFYGSDSAPHGIAAKECACGAAGVYSAPTAIPLLIEFFERHGALKLLPAFVGSHGARHYGIPICDTSTRFVRSDWNVPRTVDGVVPLASGSRLTWKVSDDTHSSEVE